MTIKISAEIPKWETPATAPGIRDELFPAQLHDAETGELLLEVCRVAIGSDRVWVFADAPQGVVCVLSKQMYDLAGDRWDGFTITLADPTSVDPGHTLLITRSGKCGCGSRLKSFRPFRHSVSNASI